VKVGIDLTALLPIGTGVDTYLKQLVIHLGRLDQKNQYTIFVTHEGRSILKDVLPPNFAIASYAVRPRPARLLFQQLWLPAAAAFSAIDVIHSPSFLSPFYRGRQRHLLTVHDMTFFSMPECHTRLHRSRAFRQAIVQSIRGADLVSVPSNSTKQDLLGLVPEVSASRVRIIPYGIDEDFMPADDALVQAALRRLRLPERYILYVGSIEPRKNLQHLVRSYRRLIADENIAEHLVLAGPLGWSYEPLIKQLELPELRGRVHMPGNIARHDLPWLYAGARLFVYPSLYEGFGFPPLEAMACGVPTVASSCSSLGENLHGAAKLVPANDEAALTLAINRLLRDEELRAQYRKKGLARAAEFCWRKTAQQTLNCYMELAP
jgi:glycosyltransferase involved in cell wall biosynthesis